jgi:hypothetical protein
MAKKRKYEPRIFESRSMTSADLERVHKEILGFERIEVVSDPMRALIEELWPELCQSCRRSHERTGNAGASTSPRYWPLSARRSGVWWSGPDPNHVWCTLAKASPKGTNPGKNGLRQRVIKVVLSLHRGGAPIDNRLFARVGEALSIPAETAKSIYYDKASKNLLHLLGSGLIFWEM